MKCYFIGGEGRELKLKKTIYRPKGQGGAPEALNFLLPVLAGPEYIHTRYSLQPAYSIEVKAVKKICLKIQNQNFNKLALKLEAN